MKNSITIAICTYDGAAYLPNLLQLLSKQHCPIPFEILVVDNNSTDSTAIIVKEYSENSEIPIRYVMEKTQGIPFARNRAIQESLGSKYMAFLDVDEIPAQEWLNKAVYALKDLNADCVGGQIEVDLAGDKPNWLSDNLLPFLGQVKQGAEPFWIVDRSTPVWSGNVAYKTSLFSDGLRFDTRYNRRGKGVGGGSDGIMFRRILKQQRKIRFEPKMAIVHLIPREKITRTYFIKLHFIAGKKAGMYEAEQYSRTILGVPPFLVSQGARQCLRAVSSTLSGNTSRYVRDAMNAAYTLGMINGYYLRSKQQPDAHSHGTV